jgi:hypothetical protein
VVAIALGVGSWLAALAPDAPGWSGNRVRSVVVQHRLRTAFRELALTSWPGVLRRSSGPRRARKVSACMWRARPVVSADDLGAERRRSPPPASARTSGWSGIRGMPRSVVLAVVCDPRPAGTWTDPVPPVRRLVARDAAPPPTDTVEIAAATPDHPQPSASWAQGRRVPRIREILGRRPTDAELAMYSVMWSEHCSYKSSKVHLRYFGETTTTR